MVTFKAYLARWMAVTTQLCPWTASTIMPMLTTSAEAAAQQCTGGASGTTCGTTWTTPYDGTYGPGQQMTATSVIANLLIANSQAPLSAETGGNSTGDVNAGTTVSTTPVLETLSEITTGDKVGAGLLTAIFAIGTLGGAWWMTMIVLEEIFETGVICLRVGDASHKSTYFIQGLPARTDRKSSTNISSKITANGNNNLPDLPLPLRDAPLPSNPGRVYNILDFCRNTLVKLDGVRLKFAHRAQPAARLVLLGKEKEAWSDVLGPCALMNSFVGNLEPLDDLDEQGRRTVFSDQVREAAWALLMD
ncbi:hypothetical protein MRB53_039245 [Persea americana]|nr:hypothetical protein MRB53_039245 [Persea americana]